MKQIFNAYKSWTGLLILLGLLMVILALCSVFRVIPFVVVMALFLPLFLLYWIVFAMMIAGERIKKYVAYRMRDVAIWLIHHSEPYIERESMLQYLIIGDEPHRR